jgi:hypothetical protein
MAGDPRLLFQAKSLPIPAIHGKTRSTIGVRSPRSAKARQALGEGGAVCVLRPRPDLGRGVDDDAPPHHSNATASTGGSSFSPLATMSSISSGNGR